MVNNRQKMYQTNTKVRKWLLDHGFTHLYFFPHLRFQKGFVIQGEEFDGIATQDNDLVLFQIKTNRRISKRLLVKYRELAKRYGVRCIWLNCVDRKGVKVSE